MEGRNDQGVVSPAGLRVLSALVEASKLYRVRHVKTERYLRVDSLRREKVGSNGCLSLAWWSRPVPGPFDKCSWDKQAALGLAKFWISLTGDMDVEIEEVKP